MRRRKVILCNRQEQIEQWVQLLKAMQAARCDDVAQDSGAKPPWIRPGLAEYLRRKVAGGAIARTHRGWRCRRRGPRDVVEVEEVKQVRLHRIAQSQIFLIADKEVLDKSDDRRVIHGYVRNIMPTRERRDHDVRDPEAKLGSKTVFGYDVRA